MISLYLMWMSVARAEGVESLWYDFTNRSADVYVLAPSAIPMGAGRVSVSQQLYLNTVVSAGIHDHASLVISASPPLWLMGELEGADDRAFASYGLKAGWQTLPGLYLGGGAEARVLAGDLYGIGYLSTTWGSRDSNLTLSGGAARRADSGAVDGLLVLSGQHRVGEHLALLSESWLLVDRGDLLSSVGARWLSRRWTVDLVRVHADGESWPWLNVTRHWGG